jgi:site-specific recombinase XerC
MLFDWLITGQVLPTNPAAAVRGPKHVVKTGKTPVLEGAEWRKLLDGIPTDTLRDLRDRALIASDLFLRASHRGAEDEGRAFRSRGAGWTLLLHEKGGKEHAMPCHHALAEALRAYIDTRRHCRGPQGMAVPHGASAQCRCAHRPPDESIRCLAHDPPACGGGRNHRTDR